MVAPSSLDKISADPATPHYQTKLLKKTQPEANVLMADFLLSNPNKPKYLITANAEREALAMRWDTMKGEGILSEPF